MSEADDKLLNGSKLSLLDLLHRVSINQFFAAVGSLLAIGFVAGRLHCAFIEKKESDNLASSLTKKEQRVAELETISTQCKQSLQQTQTELANLRKRKAAIESETRVPFGN